MRTTIDIDRDLLDRGREALGARTYREAIIRSLTAAIERAELLRLVDSLEGSDAVWELDRMLEYRRTERGDPA